MGNFNAITDPMSNANQTRQNNKTANTVAIIETFRERKKRLNPMKPAQIKLKIK